jgi:hypothetical protein
MDHAPRAEYVTCERETAMQSHNVLIGTCAAALAITGIAAAQSPAPGTAQAVVAPAAAAPDDNQASAPHRGRWLKADARVCLEFPTNMQIVKCSEKYR